MNEQQLRDKLRKIAALFEGATTEGERSAAAAAIGRIRKALDSMRKTEPAVEFHVKVSDDWQRRLFSALCRRYGLRIYRYKRQRRTSIMVRAPQSFLQMTLWPQYIQLRDALNAYLNEATERIIREEVYADDAGASEL
jgi:DNA-binding FadR family transcriptional regulator